jgi:CRP/FNR family cyclic AMP-dependent transcriptional regulator
VAMSDALRTPGTLENADLDWLLEAGEVLRLAPEHVLIEEGLTADRLYVVLDGELVVSRAGVPISSLGVGEIVGEMSLLNARSASATVRTAAGSEVLAVPYATLHARLRLDPAFSSRFHQALGRFLANRLRRADTLLLPLGEAPSSTTGEPG